MTVRQLLASADSRELQEWIVYFEADAERREAEAARQKTQRWVDGV